MEMAQLHQYHEACRREELERLEQEHNDCVDEIKHDFELEIEDRDHSLELGEHKNKKLKHGDSIFGREFLWKERKEAGDRLWGDYFASRPHYPERYF